MKGEKNNTGMNSRKQAPIILMPLPDRDFDPNESTIPRQACTSRGWLNTGLFVQRFAKTLEQCISTSS